MSDDGGEGFEFGNDGGSGGLFNFGGNDEEGGGGGGDSSHGSSGDDEGNADGDDFHFGNDEEVTEESWGSRLKSACAGICIGLILFVGSFPLLYWNEGRAVERYDTLEEGQLRTTSISASSIDSDFEGALVHFTADVKSADGNDLTDPTFGVSTADLKLRRYVEMYQWRETVSTKKVKKAGGGTKTTKTYSYQKTWSSSTIDSSSFKDSSYRNPDYMRFEQRTFAADTIMAGEFVLPPDIVDRMSWYTPVSGVSAENIPDDSLRSEAEEWGSNGLYFGTSSSNPRVGDTRVTFDSVKPGTITVVAQQNGNTFTEYEAEAGGTILLFREGNHTLESMYDRANSENQAVTWALRFVGFLVMGFGIYLVLRPIEVFADVIPCVGDVVGCGLSFLAFFFAGILSGLTISVAWLIHHPMIGGIVLAVIVSTTVGIAMLVKCIQKKKKKNDKLEGNDDFKNELKMQQTEPHKGGGRTTENEVDMSNVPTTQGYVVDSSAPAPIPYTQGHSTDPPAPASIPITQGYVVDSSASAPGNANGF